MRQYADLLRRVAAGEVTAEQAAMKSPALKRRAESVCPCSKGVRWVDVDEPGAAEKLPPRRHERAAARRLRTGLPRAVGL